MSDPTPEPCGCWFEHRVGGSNHTIHRCPTHDAAPALLAALEGIINCPDCKPKWLTKNGHLDAARVAIAKAKGES